MTQLRRKLVATGASSESRVREITHPGGEARVYNGPYRMTPDLSRAIEAVRKADNILVITGAGISAASGIPTFRGEGGFWRSHDPARLATARAFHEDPKTVWEWYDYRRQVIAGSAPNPAHRALAALENGGREVFVITQNVDDLHERAGSRHVVHIHGSIWQVTCLKEGRTYECRQTPLVRIPPHCECGGLLRPNVVWFDEELPAAETESIEDWFAHKKPQVVLVVGTEATFDYIREYIARARSLAAVVIEINPVSTAATALADIFLRETAAEALASIEKEVDA